mgnify:FL=1
MLNLSWILNIVIILYITMEILLITVIFADGRPIGDGSRHIKDTPIKYEDRMCKYSLRQFIRQFRNKGVTQIHR